MVGLSGGENMCNRLDTIPACDGQTNGQTDILRRHSPRYAYASRGKNEVATVIETIYYNEPSHLLDFVDD